MTLLAELERRNFIRVALFYIVSAWLVLRVAETVLPLFEVPDSVLRGVVILLVLGFVPTLICFRRGLHCSTIRVAPWLVPRAAVWQ